MPGKCLRGAVIEIDLEPVVGREQAKRRPCVVVQNDTSNAFSYTTIVAPITGAEHIKRKSPTHVFVKSGLGGLTKDSYILCDQIRTVDEQRFRKNCGHLPASVMDEVDKALKISLGLDDDW
ncbi:MAG: type II toxin-antitoxin system PemK/MazF family toxin [Rhodospirillales bacterium]